MASREGPVPFEVTGAALEDAPVWRVDLPADARLAGARLAGLEATLSHSHAALAAAGDRLVALARSGPAGVAFDAPSEPGTLSPAEADLLLALRAIQEGSRPVSFDLAPALPGAEPLLQRLIALVEQLQRSAAHFVWVETQIEGQFLGRTVVSWSGDVDTVWREGVDPEQAALHERTLALAVASRTTWLRRFSLALWGAVQLAAVLTTPGGALLALPAVWRFIERVQAEPAGLPGHPDGRWG